jgi:ribose/xylose/arabinose/galactoside ABC-type transport system permease subunit
LDVSLLLFQGRWLCLGGQRPGNAYLYVLVAWEWTVACFTVGTACAAIAANLFALKHHYCDPRAACGLYLIAATAAFAVGSLAAASALGIVWMHGSRFRPAQAP